ncbi:MAG: hypothetical protein AVDCRST_MAG93-6918, partial [uncultured Chloroflexia bacterium]
CARSKCCTTCSDPRQRSTAGVLARSKWGSNRSTSRNR